MNPVELLLLQSGWTVTESGACYSSEEQAEENGETVKSK